MLEILITLVVVFVSVALHEVAHGLASYILGDDTAKREGRLTLNLFAHMDMFTSVILPMILFLLGGPIFGGAKPVPIDTRKLKWKEWGMAIVALAGPMTNFIIALVAFLIGYHTGVIFESGTVLMKVLLAIISVNLGFFAFNLIPIPPLDGSRVLYAFAPDGIREKMEQIERGFGIMIVFMMIMFFGTAFSSITAGIIKQVLNFFYFLVGA